MKWKILLTIFIFLTLKLFAQVNYEGTWTGEYRDRYFPGTLELQIKARTNEPVFNIYLKTKGIAYVGISYLRTRDKRKAKYLFYAREENNKLIVDEVLNLERLGIPEEAKRYYLSYEKKNGDEILSSPWVSLKRKSLKVDKDIANKDAEITNLLTLSPITFASKPEPDDSRTNVIRPGSESYVSSTFTNTSGLIFHNIDFAFSIDSNFSSGDVSLYNGSHFFTDKKYVFSHSSFGSMDAPFKLYSKATVPKDSVKVNFYIAVDGWVLKEISTKIATKPYFKNDTHFFLPPQNSAIAAALNYYYNDSLVNTNICINRLTLSANAGVAKAAGWLVLFSFKGLCNVPQNEKKAYQLLDKYKPAKQINELAREGDVEAVYLTAYINAIIDTRTGTTTSNYDSLVYLSAANNFIPAIYDVAQRYLDKSSYDSAYKILRRLYYGNHFGSAGFNLAQMLENGWGVNKNNTEAIQLYSTLAKANNTDALMRLAEINLETETTKKEKAIAFLSTAAEQGNTNAMLFIASEYLNDSIDLQHANTIKDNLNKAADMGNHDAMLSLGILYYTGNKQSGIESNPAIAANWLIKAAKAGNSNAMTLLAALYQDEKFPNKSICLSRYWQNKAMERGNGQGAINTPVQVTALYDFLDGLSTYRPHVLIQTINQYGDVISERYQDNGILDYALAGVMNMFIQGRQQKQEIIDEIKLVDEDENVYAATLTHMVTVKNIHAGQLLNMKVSGTVNFGFFAGNGDANGILSKDPNIMGYSYQTNINHGAVMFKINDGDFVASKRQISNYKLTESGSLYVIVNDKEYINNQGYFDIVIRLQ